MPDIDGLALAAMIRQQAELSATRLILLTSARRQLHKNVGGCMKDLRSGVGVGRVEPALYRWRIVLKSSRFPRSAISWECREKWGVLRARIETSPKATIWQVRQPILLLKSR
jgi:hypothetical protein